MPFIQPKTIALDSSHFADAARDFTSQDETKRSLANQFSVSMETNGFIPLMCLSHLEEVLRHRNETVVQNVLTFIASIRLMAWVGGYNDPRVMGSIADILAFEAHAAFRKPNASVLETRDAAAGKLFQFGSGMEAIAPYLEVWSEFRLWLLSREEQSMETVAISTSNFTEFSKVKIRDILPLEFRSVDDRRRKIEELEHALFACIKASGDRRIINPSKIAHEFMARTAKSVERVSQSSANAIGELLALHDVELAELEPDATVEDVGNIATFRRKLSVANRDMKLPWHSLKSTVGELRVPSGLLQAGIRRFGQELIERKGSELSDAYLACLAPYADVILVDKRTLENIVRATRKQPFFGALIRKAISVGNYTHIPDQVRQLLN